MISAIFIFTLLLKLAVTDWTNFDASYGDSSVKIKRSVDHHDDGSYRISPADSSAGHAAIEPRLYSKIINSNKNIILGPGSGNYLRRHPKRRPKSKQLKVVPTPEPETESGKVVRDIVAPDVLEKLQTTLQLRENAINVMGYLLQLPRERLTAHQYTSLEIIYNAFKQRSVNLYNLLPVLKKMDGKSGSIQFALLVNGLIDNVPDPLTSAVEYMTSQISQNAIDLNKLLQGTKDEGNLLKNIPQAAIDAASVTRESDTLSSYDEGSKITEDLLGPVYVSIFREYNNLQASKTSTELSQLLFGLILSDLPNPDGDPIFEEYVRYIAEEATHERIPNWNYHGLNPDCKDPYTLLGNLVKGICGDVQVSAKMKKLLLYVWNHIELSKGPRNDDATESNVVNGVGLLQAHFDESIHQLGLQLQSIVATNSEVNQTLTDVNRYMYRYPREQMLAFLAKVQTKLTNEAPEIERVTSALAANLMVVKGIPSHVITNVPLWMLMDIIDTGDSQFRDVADALEADVFKNVDLWRHRQELTTAEKSHCNHPKECVLDSLERMGVILQKEGADPVLIDTVATLANVTQRQIEDKHSSADSMGDEHNEDSVEIESRSYHSSHKRSKKSRPSIFEQLDAFLEHLIAPEIEDEEPDPIVIPEPSTPSDSESESVHLKSSKSHLPSSIDPTKCLVFTKPSSGPYVVQSLNPGIDYQAPGAIILPSIVHLEEKPRNKTSIINMCESHLTREIVTPMRHIFGTDYIEKTIGTSNWTPRFPTRVSLLVSLLQNASLHSEVQEQPELLKNIHKTLYALQYVSSYLLLPLVANVMHLETNITWITFGNNTDEKFHENPDKNLISFSKHPPPVFDDGPIYTMPLVNPKTWLDPVEDADPYPSLLPEVEQDSIYEVALRPLVEIFHRSAIETLLGKEMVESKYANKGELFVSTLYQLRSSESVKADKVLSGLVENYLKVILPASIYIRVPVHLITRGMPATRRQFMDGFPFGYPMEGPMMNEDPMGGPMYPSPAPMATYEPQMGGPMSPPYEQPAAGYTFESAPKPAEQNTGIIATILRKFSSFLRPIVRVGKTVIGFASNIVAYIHPGWLSFIPIPFFAPIMQIIKSGVGLAKQILEFVGNVIESPNERRSFMGSSRHPGVFKNVFKILVSAINFAAQLVDSPESGLRGLIDLLPSPLSGALLTVIQMAVQGAKTAVEAASGTAGSVNSRKLGDPEVGAKKLEFLAAVGKIIIELAGNVGQQLMQALSQSMQANTMQGTAIDNVPAMPYDNPYGAFNNSP